MGASPFTLGFDSAAEEDSTFVLPMALYFGSASPRDCSSDDSTLILLDAGSADSFTATSTSLFVEVFASLFPLDVKTAVVDSSSTKLRFEWFMPSSFISRFAMLSVEKYEICGQIDLKCPWILKFRTFIFLSSALPAGCRLVVVGHPVGPAFPPHLAGSPRIQQCNAMPLRNHKSHPM